VISIRPVEGLPEIQDGDDLGALIAEHIELEAGDIVVVAQKVVSKAEGRVVRLPTSSRRGMHANWRARSAIRASRR
jgi:coenzyme F420-0:L-glutamate ligase/coenzyme F420-1:gamma-L-glutamate ligase